MQKGSFFCAACDKSFTSAGNLNKHRNTLIHKNISEKTSTCGSVSEFSIIDNVYTDNDFGQLEQHKKSPF